MPQTPYVFESLIGGRSLRLETGKLAEQANAAVTVQYGETIVLVTVCASKEPREGIDFLPLTIDYEERLYAAGKIPGGWFKREGRPSEDAILAARLTDRPLRPLFPKGLRTDIQVVATVLSADRENDPDILSIIGASAALTISDIPFSGPVAATRIGMLDGHFVVNPTFSERNESSLDLVVAGAKQAVVMVEAGAMELPESTMLEAIRLAQETNAQIIATQEQMAAAVGKPKFELAPVGPAKELLEAVEAVIGGRLAQALFNSDKAQREESLDALRREAVERIQETYAGKDVSAAFEELLKKEMRRSILERGVRPDNRGLAEVRPIWSEVGALPRTHGSGLFTRGQTQVLTIVTLGSPGEEQRFDSITPEESKRFLHHYNMPPFSVGEARRIGSPGRREVGHGALVERALTPIIPDEAEFPYTIRLVSEALSSNGSTSMGSVCASILALMDAGVPIKAPLAGAAMGLIMGEDGKYAVLTDIQGIEDHLGDMDFKVAGSAEGITALQMDIKVTGITYEVMEKALAQARDARLFILGRMLETMDRARPELSKYAPRMYRMMVHPDKIRTIIGPGGKTIRSIIEETKVTINVEDDGTVVIGSPDAEAAQKAIKRIEDLTREVEVGVIYTGKVTRIMNFGAFVEILPGKEGLVHVSELADYHVPSVEDVVKLGDEIMVKVTEIDRMGRINLSRRAVLEPTGAGAEGGAPARTRPEGPPRREGRPFMGGDRGPRPNGRRGGPPRRGPGLPPASTPR